MTRHAICLLSCIAFFSFVSMSEGQPGPKAILPPGQTLKDLQKFIEERLPPMPKVTSREAWEKEANRLREDMLAKIVYRGEAAVWRDAKTKVEWLDALAGGPGYRLKKVRFEALPGMWIPAILYEPDNLKGKVPATLNVMGHDGGGKDVAYQQIRCINLAKRGLLALNVEWFGFGQLKDANFHHARMNQLDLCGTSGLAPFYLALKRGLDVLLDHPHADPQRVAVSGLSGGGWQTIYISALDTRVTLTNPVAGYSSFKTRIRHHKDLGDSEQTPCDMATVADYDHLTALMAPRATLLTYNAKDECCFESGYALPPLMEAAAPIFRLYSRKPEYLLRGHVNHVPGTHNFEKDNRQAFYRMIGAHFFPDDKNYQNEEIPCDKEIKNRQELAVPLPKANANFHSLASALAKKLPRFGGVPRDKDKLPGWQKVRLDQLRKVVKFRQYVVKATPGGDEPRRSWIFRLGDDWHVPGSEHQGKGKATTLLLHDGGRHAAEKLIDKARETSAQVLAIDPFYFGETKVGQRDYLWALLVSAVGERPLGVQASQVAAIARWAREQHKAPVTLVAHGPRTSLVALVAAALEKDAIAGVEMHGCLTSLKDIIEQNRTVVEMPEMFCFGLLEALDIYQLHALSSPRPVRVVGADQR